MSLYTFPLLLHLSLIISSAIPSHGSPPSPGYSPSSRVKSIGFNQGFKNLWGPQHQSVQQDSVSIWLDKNSGSGFKSLRAYRSGYFGASIKLQSGFTAGVDTSLYLSNNQEHPKDHDEIDMEFLGTTPGKPYTLQTNVFVRGSGDNVVGREVKFNLWFDPTQDFHDYGILWNPFEIIFLVDDVPIRRYAKKNDATFPTRPMWVYGSIWDASDWATEDGKIKADYKYQPFIGRFKNFKLAGCTSDGPSSCRPPSAGPAGGFQGLSRQQMEAMTWVQRNYLVYDYCHDPKRDHSQSPEC